MEKGRKIIAVLAVCSVLIMLSGCWSNVEIRELALIIGVAIDVGEGEGEYKLTAQIAKPAALSPDGSSSGGESFSNITATGIGIQATITAMTAQLDRRLYIGHNEVIVISKEVAQEGVAGVLDYFVRSSESR